MKHLQNAHGQLLERYKANKRQLSESQSTFTSDGHLSKRRKEFGSQDSILTSLVRNLVGTGGLSIQVAEQEWFRKFMSDVEPRFQPVSRVAVKKKLNILHEEERDSKLKEIADLSFKPSVTLDFWTGRDGRSFMGCTVHYVVATEKKLSNHMLFFKEIPPHTADNIRNKFEDHLDLLNISSFVVVTDNAANMKCAFHMTDSDDSDDIYEDEEDIELAEPPEHEGWTVNEPHFDTWIGCAAHKLQLVVHKGYRELLAYRRVQAAFNKAKSICTLSRKSSHLNHTLSTRIPVPNETRWNSHVRLHDHVLKHFDNINEALNKVDQKLLVLSITDKENLTNVVHVMQYFAEATDLLQAEKYPTSCSVIPVIDSLENALLSIDREVAAVNALCEALLNGLQHHFSHLLDSKIHLSATALDPHIKLTFTDNADAKKFFKFSSAVVKRQIRSFLPPRLPVSTQTTPVAAEDGSRKKRLLEYSFHSQYESAMTPTNNVDVELQTYLESPTVDSHTKNLKNEKR